MSKLTVGTKLPKTAKKGHSLLAGSHGASSQATLLCSNATMPTQSTTPMSSSGFDRSHCFNESVGAPSGRPSLQARVGLEMPTRLET